MKTLAGFGLALASACCVISGPASAQGYQQTCRQNYLGGYSCSDSNGYDVRVRPSMGIYGGYEAQDNYGNRCRRYQDYMGRIVTTCN